MSTQPGPETVPALPRGVRLRHDPARGGWVLLAPERIVTLDEIAHAVVALVDGERDLATIADALAKEYAADAGDILTDIAELVASLHDRGLLDLRAAR
ncbi:Coenzyme PQQ synthesis protein D [plant metagenome]|uniref:Coenzyme PQQ synthesis protein D n=1 Tax=plant metagenome TaxID=1297885 RepID=A0A484SHY4_9ZZZZ